MPKSNFNQFLDECEDFKTFESKKISKISFEINTQTHHDPYKCENQYQNQTVNVSSSSETSSNATLSSNIFLSANGQGQNGFSTNRFNTSENAKNTRRENNNNNNNNNNMFKKMDANQTAVQNCGGASSSSHTLEINNQTFPSLVQTSIVSSTTNNTVPKKFKNFKDAICSSADKPLLSPTKQKQIKAMALKQSSVLHHPHPLAVKAVKKDSEMYAKRILAKTKNVAYDDDEDDDDYHDDDNNEESLYQSHYKPNFMKRRCNDSDDSDD